MIAARIALVAAVAIAGAVVAGCGGVVRAGAPAAAPESPPALTPERPEVVPPAGRGGADLRIAEIMVSDRNPAAGGTFVLSVIVGNDGTAAAPATRVRFVRSADEAITTDDSEVGMVDLPPIAVAGRAGGSAVVSASESGGTFHYGACVEAVSGESETGNNCSAAVAVVVAASGEPGQPPEPGSPGPGSPEPAPSGADLTVAAPMASDANPAAGASFTLSATVRNRGTARSGFTYLRFYRSTDATITVADTEESGTIQVTRLAASGSVTKWKVVSAPASGGTYYYGACVDAALGETETGNNCSPAVTVTVRAPPPGNPDLRIDSTQIYTVGSRGTLYVNYGIELSAAVQNAGGGSSSVATLRFYVSTSQAVPASDRTEVGTVAIPQIVGSREFVAYRDLNAPATAGTWYYRACVDAVADESDTTNNCGEVVELRVHADAPDFSVLAETSDGTVSAGGTFSIEVRVWNRGTIASGTTTLRYYRSVDATISSADSELDTVAIAQLDTGILASRRHSFQVTAPDTAGTYYYGACVDAAPNEVTTTDNCSSAVSVTVQ